MTRNGTAAILFCTLGAAAALAVTSSRADPPINNQPATVFRTVVETRTVAHRLDGKPIRWWANRARANARTVRGQRVTLRRIRADVRRRFAGTVSEAVALARVVYGVDQTRRVQCESGGNPFAVEGHGPVGLLQFVPSTFGSTPFGVLSIWSPYAQALAGGWMVAVAHRSNEWSCPLR